jgi:hypothetical protein
MFYFVILIGCKKEPPPVPVKDYIIPKDVRGMVFNTCTDSGLSGIKVYLKMYHRKKLLREYSTISGLSGNFTFTNIEMHSSPEYEQTIYIPSKSGDHAKDFETCGIRGTSMWFTFGESDIFLKPPVVPKFIYFAFYFPRQQTTVASDSIIASCEQRTYHNNVPDYPYKFGAGAIGIEGGTYPKRIGNYPMGLYHIKVDKWVNGVHTQWFDSVYAQYGDSAKYVAYW